MAEAFGDPLCLLTRPPGECGVEIFVHLAFDGEHSEPEAVVTLHQWVIEEVAKLA
jgi:hypothetical protein